MEQAMETPNMAEPENSVSLRSSVAPCWASDDGNVQLYHADCLDVLPLLSGLDAVITDPPYGVTQNKWDVALQLDDWWSLIKPICDGAVVMTATQPFTTDAIVSNRQWFKWADVWKKTQSTGHLNANVMPLRQHEDILVFCRGKITYNPQLTAKPLCDARDHSRCRSVSTNYGKYKTDVPRGPQNVSYPRSVLEFANCQDHDHPTQKPVKLFQNFVLQYTADGATVLDPFMGSGTTGIACIRSGRKFIGIERDAKYFEIAKERIRKELQVGRLF